VPPPLLRQLNFEMLDAFDDMALRVFVDPCDGVEPATLARACSGTSAALAVRIRECLPEDARPQFEQELRLPQDAATIEAALDSVLASLFWPIVYWHFSKEYDELASAERIHPQLLEDLDLDGRVVCDIGAGAGRFSLYAARRAGRVVAVDAALPLLRLLERKASQAKVDNLTLARGSFAALPLPDASVDVVVACSAFTSSGPHGGHRALEEAERIAKPGAEVVIIWPQEHLWFERRGYNCRRYEGNDVMRFRDAESAARLCGRYHSSAAEAWVREHHSADVPYSVVGSSPPNSVCIKRVPW
jgi:ubiquinone/menaquinone biosynthesis C-methylase UbiE